MQTAIQHQRQLEGKMRHPGVLSTIRQLRSDKNDFALRNKDLATANKRLKEEVDRIVNDAKGRAEQYDRKVTEMQQQFVSAFNNMEFATKQECPHSDSTRWCIFFLIYCNFSFLSPFCDPTQSSLLGKLKRDNARLEAQLIETDDQLQAARKRSADNETKARAYAKQAHSLTTENERLLKLSDEQEQGIALLRASLKEAKALRLHNQFQRYRTETNEEIKRLRSITAHTQAEKNRLQAMVGGLISQNRSLQNSYKELQAHDREAMAVAGAEHRAAQDAREKLAQLITKGGDRRGD